VHFRMRDQGGRVVGSGISPPIMITDDHKSTGVNAAKQMQTSYDAEWEPRAPLFPSAVTECTAADAGPARRRSSLKEPFALGKKRLSKPYDSGRSMLTRSRRSEPSEGNVYPTVLPITNTNGNPYPDTSSITPFTSASPSTYSSTAPSSPQSFEPSSLPSPPSSNRYPSPINTSFLAVSDNADTIMDDSATLQSSFFPLTPPLTAPSSPPQDFMSQTLQEHGLDLSTFPYALMQPRNDGTHSNLPPPKIHRLIPSTGPTFGGIEVTILGSNFDPSVLYNCVFGDVASSSTTRWSENTLVCLLPPRAEAGVVPVSLQGIKADEENPADPVLFTYTDESDRSLYVHSDSRYLF